MTSKVMHSVYIFHKRTEYIFYALGTQPSWDKGEGQSDRSFTISKQSETEECQEKESLHSFGNV